MKFTLSWLKDHLDTNCTAAQVVDAMTMAGLEVEHVTDPATKLAPFPPAGRAQLQTASGTMPSPWPCARVHSGASGMKGEEKGELFLVSFMDSYLSTFLVSKNQIGLL